MTQPPVQVHRRMTHDACDWEVRTLIGPWRRDVWATFPADLLAPTAQANLIAAVAEHAVHAGECDARSDID